MAYSAIDVFFEINFLKYFIHINMKLQNKPNNLAHLFSSFNLYKWSNETKAIINRHNLNYLIKTKNCSKTYKYIYGNPQASH